MSDPATFPPATIEAFLRFCEGEWMTLRSRFQLGSEADAGEGDEWHSSERGELVVRYVEPSDSRQPGGISVGPKDQTPRQLLFAADGSFTAGDQQGSWTLWPDGSLELVSEQNDAELRERIWFNKPNLRLRSTIEQPADGTPGRASFSSEIRRVSKPATPAA
ncbi:phycobiliprotein lyase [Vulcanococcus sp. Clear-D1]|uniref:phycobiliprotein lyase n=1 Tax=Vulcanococcus sp. Clear-D1 TaxID=2766970 RepID=UPI001998F592|nr:phycobiliprotein lyase [Vulcanococcus sp. Clear-D1]MBD1195182.1 phycobiliprotein lyase [Vulcanococcus sp. Clear-D1]